MNKATTPSIYRSVSAAVVVGVALIGLPEKPLHAAPWQFSQSTEQPSPIPQPAPDSPSGIPADGTPATVIDDHDAEGILGKNVRSSAGEDMGQIVDVIVKRDGQVRGAVIDFGGFLGVGSRKIAVDWGALSFPSSGAIDHAVLNLTRDQVRLAPEYRPGEPVVVLGSAGELQPKPETSTQSETPAPEK
jgi:PRC-barrel domain protein